MKSLRGIIYALISSGTFGLIPLFCIPLMNENHMSLPSILFYRFLISTLIMGLICFIKKENFKISSKHIFIILFLSGLYTVTALCLQYSYKSVPSGIATTIHFLYPVCVSFLMVVFFKEKKSWVLLFAALFALLGVSILCWSSGGNVKITGLLTISITVFTYAIYIITINKTAVSTLSSEVLTFYILLFGTMSFFCVASFSGGVQPVLETSAYIRLFLLAFVPTVISNLALVSAIKYAGSTVTSILGSMEPLVAVLVGVFYFSEYFGINSFIGILLILLSVTMVILFRAGFKLGKIRSNTKISEIENK